MYQVRLLNRSPLTLTTSDGQTIAPNGTWQTAGNLGNAWARSTEGGTLYFQDIGNQHIPGDSGETWGVLITYQGEEFVGRYEGGGQLHVTFNKFMQARLSGMDLRQVDLPALQIG